PIPAPERAYAVGTALREMLRAYPGPERIAVIATGGLSHEPGGPRYFWGDEEIDLWFLDLLKKGDHETLLRECTLERMEGAGAGGGGGLGRDGGAARVDPGDGVHDGPGRGARLHARHRLALGHGHGRLEQRRDLSGAAPRPERRARVGLAPRSRRSHERSARG